MTIGSSELDNLYEKYFKCIRARRVIEWKRAVSLVRVPNNQYWVLSKRLPCCNPRGVTTGKRTFGNRRSLFHSTQCYLLASIKLRRDCNQIAINDVDEC